MGLFGSKPPTLAIEVERPDGVYYPGETVRTRVTVATEDEAKFREIRAGLVLAEKYQTIEESRDSDGDRTTSYVWRTNEQWTTKEIVATDGLAAGFHRTFAYEWRLPETAVPFCDGKIIKARWLVKATVDIPRTRDVNAEAVLYVVVPPPQAQTQPGEYVEENSAPAAVRMRFALPRLEFVQGETCGGRLLVEPLQEIKPRAVRVELARRETVPGYRTNVERVVEQTLSFNTGPLRPGTPAAIDFALTIPPKWCPTYRSGYGQATWYVNAALDIPWGKDFVAAQPIAVFNGSPRPGRSAAKPTVGVLNGIQPEDAAAACGNCGGAYLRGARFCGQCGQPLPQA